MGLRRIFLARHGNRQDFVDSTWRASALMPDDPPLSVDGIEQARRLGQRLASEGIVAIVASPFLRTIQTAHHANEALGVPIYLEPGFGEWLSTRYFPCMPRVAPLEQLRAQYPRLTVDGYTASWAMQYPESEQQLLDRAQRTLLSLVDKFEGPVLVVGHAGSVAAASLIDTRVTNIDCPLCALFCLEHDGERWHLSINAEVSHVGERLAVFTFPREEPRPAPSGR
jgi:broad specificity phosphatase PhoE